MLVTEPLRLEMGHHWELIRFMVAPNMTKVVILGLAWLDKSGPTISWEDGYRKLKLALGPLSPSSHTEGRAASKSAGANQNEKAAATAEPPPGSHQIPREYLDFAAVLSEEECNSLPPPIAPRTAP